jgi:hypothetical protein
MCCVALYDQRSSVTVEYLTLVFVNCAGSCFVTPYSWVVAFIFMVEYYAKQKEAGTGST